MATAEHLSDTPTGSWARAYPPLLLVLIAFLMAAAVLPSALNLPQSNPSTVLEYAPVPPEDDSPSPPEGNVSSLGLGSSGTLTSGGRPPDPPAPPPDDDFEGRGDRPNQKNCIGHHDPDGTFVVRQTEDPMSPECVPYFDADNGGATYQGVTEKEITVVLYLDNGGYAGGEVNDTGYYDVDAPPKPRCAETYPSANPNVEKCDHVVLRAARALTRHFNYRYQLYGRRVHLWLFVTSSSTEPARRSDAVKIWKERQPFAVIDQAKFHGFNEAFDDSLAARGVMSFTSKSALREQFFQKNKPYAWGFWPDVPHWAQLHASYICQKLKDQPVRWSGNPQGNPQNGYNGQDRKFGLWHTDAPGEPGLRKFAEDVDRELRRCDIHIGDEARATFEHTGFATDNDDPGTDQAEAIARFKTNNVTTVLWLGGIESKFTKEADAAEYYPEIMFAGDLDMDGNDYGVMQARNVWQNAWGTSFQLRQDHPDETHSTQAAREGDSSIDNDAAYHSTDLFRDFFMLFQTIQVAGPRLTPDQIDTGMHALKKTRSNSPHRAAFFFDDDDFSSVKDAMLISWDPNGIPPGWGNANATGSSSNQPGCWRMVQGPRGHGHRSLAWEWPQFESDPFEDPEAPCTSFAGRAGIRP